MAHSTKYYSQLVKNIYSLDSETVNSDESELVTIGRFVIVLKNIIFFSLGALRLEGTLGKELRTKHIVRFLHKVIYPLLVKHLDNMDVETEEDAYCTSTGNLVALQFKQYIKTVEGAERLAKIFQFYFT